MLFMIKYRNHTCQRIGENSMNHFLHVKKNKVEIYIGAALAVTAITAMILRMIVLGITIYTVLDMIISVTALSVSALVMFVAIRSIIMNAPKNIHQELESAFDSWETDNRPLLFKVSDFEEKEKYKICYAILTDHTVFLDLPQNLSSEMEAKLNTKNSKQSGKFLTIPSFVEMTQEDFTMEFHFVASSYIEVKSQMKDLVGKTVKSISMRFPNIRTTPKGTTSFTAEYSKITTKQEVRDLTSFVNYVLTLLLIQSQRG